MGSMGQREKSGSFLSLNGKRYHNLNGGELCGRRDLEEKEKERQRLERERAFDAGLFGPGGIIAPSAGMIELVSHLEEFKGNEEHTEVVQQSIDIDLNMSIMEGVEEGSVRAPKGYGVDGGVEQRLLSQDSDPFNLFPIIEAISRKGRKGLERMMKMICVWQKMDWIVCIRYKGL